MAGVETVTAPVDLISRKISVIAAPFLVVPGFLILFTDEMIRQEK